MTDDSARTLPGRLLSKEVVDPDGNPAIMIESLPVSSGQHLLVEFESTGRDHAEGIFLATEGVLATNGVTARAFELWAGQTPPQVDIEIIETHGALVLYNIWDRGAGFGRESQALTSGMVREELPDEWLRYSCKDYGYEAGFASVVFKVRIRD